MSPVAYFIFTRGVVGMVDEIAPCQRIDSSAIEHNTFFISKPLPVRVQVHSV